MHENETSGADLIARNIVAKGIRKIFTVPTPELQPLIDALRYIEDIEVVEARNETAAAGIADGYVRSSRCRAVALTDRRGKALSQISAVTNAWADKIPLIAIALCEDGPPDPNKGVDRHLLNQKEAFRAVTRWRTRLEKPEDISFAMDKAILETASNRMGPVYIDIPRGLLDESVFDTAGTAQIDAAAEEKEVQPMRLAGDPEAVARAARLIQKARRPLVICGAGVKSSFACRDLNEFMEKFGIPGATSMAGMGCIPVNHPLNLGGPSYAAGEAFHVAIKKADVVIGLGTAFGGLEGFGLPPLWSDGISFVHVDMDPLQLGLNVQPEVSVQGDVKTVLEQLDDCLVEEGFAASAKWDFWRGMLGNLKRDRQKRLEKNANLKSDNIHQG